MLLEIDDEKLEDFAVIIESCLQTFDFKGEGKNVKKLLDYFQEELIKYLQVTYPERFK